MVELVQQYQVMHAAGLFNGISLPKEVDRIRDLIERYKPQSLIDWGCGKAKCYIKGQVNWGIETIFYDPAVEKYATLPTKPADAVICVDVAEHIPEPAIDDFLRQLAYYANQFVYLTICTRLAKKKLPDGRNCHLTVKPPHWWRSKILTVCEDVPPFYVRFS